MERAWKCEECGTVFEDGTDFEPLYECSGCGTMFVLSNSADGVSSKCPDCSKFSKKLFEQGCPECEEGEVIEIQAEYNDENELVEIEGTRVEKQAKDARPGKCAVCLGWGHILVPDLETGGDRYVDCPKGCKSTESNGIKFQGGTK